MEQDDIAVEYSVEPVKVMALKTGMVAIVQDYCDGNEAGQIYLRPEQVDQVIEWLKAAKAEAESM